MSRLVIILLCAVWAVANGQSTKAGSLQDDNRNIYIEDDNAKNTERGDIPEYDITPDESVENISTHDVNNNDKFDDRTDGYIKYIRLQYAQFLEQCEIKLQILREYYLGSVEGVKVEHSSLIDYAVRFETVLYPLELLSNTSKNCIAKYRSNIPSVSYIKNSLNVCTLKIATEIDDSLLTKAIEFKSTVDTYYNIDFNNKIESCHQTFINGAKSKSACVQDAVSEANAYKTKAQQNFDYLIDAARCDIKAFIKRVIDCSVSVQYQAGYSIAQATMLIDNCRKGEDECKPCAQHTCSESYNLKVDYTATAIANPFYGVKKRQNCLMLNAQ